MSPANNILKFPLRGTTDFNIKLFAVLFYLFLGFTAVAEFLPFSLTLGKGSLFQALVPTPVGDVLLTLFILGLLYHFFVRYTHRTHHYLQANKTLLAILLILVLLVYRLSIVPLLLLLFLYWALVHKTRGEAPYFLKFHILNGLIVNLLLALAAYVLEAALLLVDSFKLILPVISPFTSLVIFWFLVGVAALFTGLTLWFIITVIRGRTPFLPLVTPNIRPLI